MHGRWKVVLLAALSAALFLLLLGRRQFAASHEARVAQVARQMAAAGWPWETRRIEVDRVHLVEHSGVMRLAPDTAARPMHVDPWIVPILNGEVRLQKPPLPYWCAAVAYRLFGVDEATTRLVPAVLGALATLLLFDLARLLYGSRIAWAAALIWVTTYLVPEEYRLAMADPYLAFFTLTALWAWVRGLPELMWGRGLRQTPSNRDAQTRIADPKTVPAPVSTPALPRRNLNPYLLLFYIALGLGALAKGPLIFLHVAVPLALFHVCFRARFPRGIVSHVLGVVIFLVIALPWPLAVLRQVPNATQLWRYESVGEVSGDNQEGLRAWWYYFINLPLLAMPWVPLWLFSLVYPFRRKRATVLFPFLWYGLMVLFFTVVGQKKLPYLLPVMPAQVLMLAIAAVPLLRLARRVRMRGLAGAVVAGQTIIGIGWAAALPFLVWGYRTDRVIAVPASAVAIVLALLPLREMLAARPMRWLVSQAVAYAAVLIVFCNFYLTPLSDARSPKTVCREVLALADGTHRAILESRLPEEVAFYLPLHPRQGAAPHEFLVIMDDQKGVKERARSRRPEPAPDLAEFEDWVPDAKVVGVRRVAMNGASGDSRWKVYELTVERIGLALR